MHKLDPDLAIKSIFADEQWLVKTGIGGMIYAGSLLLLLLNFFMLPLVVILLSCTQGYLLRVIRTEVAASGSALPGWHDPADLLVSGLTWMAINALFTGLGVGLNYGLAFVLAWQTMQPDSAAVPGIAVIMLAATTSAFMSFVLTYLMANLAVQETNTAGFQVGHVLKKAWGRKTEFLAAWLIGEGLKLISFALPVATVFGVFLLPSTIFIAQIAAAKLAAQAWAAEQQRRVLAGA